MSQINQKLNELGIKIPEPAVPIANYVGFVVSGKNIFISGQLPIENGELKYIGKVGANISVEDAKKAAKICAINILSQLKFACGNLEKVTKCIKLGVFVNSAEDFIDHPAIANGASDLMVEVFGNKGKHTRSAVGSSSLPCGVSVEVDAIFEIE